ncbi:ATP-binding protein [Pseudohalocynthiibacter aestuariivivens]|jgi:two-component system, OmpR family, osmolarity sensor histidine kinase EnvZ|uniref:histidine kinase n=1 Tax=Pseudohalocynthiibacter aestuariivivens TaxID=1591409 RepID=A0ABV5JFQ0_9RHOB|nr:MULTISPECIES: ATP-binding protein [Pseudohalocynthiibacter]MBS9717781.1 two-component sensor histidine kinase [Pseudohalocynthiibacter aestuariivivens]MCK0103069.1 ATP-binding protein [Pseudohalocynthiibacter sp. F2068]
MFFGWLKRFMPRSLYGRAALILIVPIVTIQLVVSIVFIQRHFDRVTQQMTQNVELELAYLLDEIEAEERLEEAQEGSKALADPLEMTITLPGAGTSATADKRDFADLTGITVIETLRSGGLPISVIDLQGDSDIVHLQVETRHGNMAVEFSRSRVSATNPHQLLVLMIAVSLLMTVIAYLFLRNQLRPIKRLAVASEAFGKGRSVPYNPSGALEVRAAGSSFLDMRSRIERQIEQRTLMLSGVSHDLRTPLTRLKLGLSMVDENEDVDAMLQDVAEMERLLDGFLNFARGAAGDELVLSDPMVIARTAVENAERAGKDVQLVSEEGAGEVLVRPTAIGRALDNLIGNAVRYGTRAEVSVAITEKAVRISVEDDGPGIAPEDREEALKPFSRLEPGRNQNKGSGVGLGLSIAIDIARGHGGTLRLSESDRLGGLKVDLVLAR